MSDLVVRGGGATSVETEALVVEAARLAAVADILDAWGVRVGGVRDRLDELAVAEPAGGLRGAVLDLDTARTGFSSAGARARELSWSLQVSAGGYAGAEWLSTIIRDGVERLGAGALGLAAPALLSAGVSAGATIAPGLGLAAALRGPDAAAGALLALLEQHGLPILSDPAFVALVRASGDHVDEFLAGLFRSGGVFGLGAGLHAPENAALLLGAAAALGALTGTRALRETDVRVNAVPTPSSAVSPLGPGAATTSPPNGIGDLAERIPSAPPGEPQIRIERYGSGAESRWIVYTSGTVDLAAIPSGEPYDTTSNLHVVADASAAAASVDLPADAGAAERAVRAAMAEAGVATGDPVLVVGHSAGGIVAANLAADAELDVVGAVSFGGPVAQVPTSTTPVLSVEHSEDLVPATGGAGVAAEGRIVVERSVAPLAPTLEDPLPAHALVAYRDTADAVDRSTHPRVQEFTDLVAAITRGEPARTTSWHAERVTS